MKVENIISLNADKVYNAGTFCPVCKHHELCVYSIGNRYCFMYKNILKLDSEYITIVQTYDQYIKTIAR